MSDNQKICLFTDSSSDLSKEEAAQFAIEVLPITITYNGETIYEHFDITPQAYWEVLKTSKELPVTSQIPPATFFDFFKRKAEEGTEKLMGILINAQGSGTYSSACIARDMYYEENGQDMQIILIDSKTYSYIYGNIIIEAAKMLQQGMEIEQVMERVQNRIDSAKTYLGVYTLSYIKKSGRISGAAAFVGEALGLKPIVRISANKTEVCDKVRGEKKVVPSLVQHVKAEIKEAEKQTIWILYAAVDKQEIENLKQQLQQEINPANILMAPIGPCVTTNTGPNAVAVLFYNN